MSQLRARSTARRVSRALCLAGAMLGGVSCRDEPTEPAAPAAPGVALATASAPLAFAQVSGGGDHTCGITTGDRAYCWGFNSGGQLGDGTTHYRTTPVAVLGGLFFRQVSAGEEHTCGVTLDYKAYCWGVNGTGRLGDGTTTSRLKPVLVAGGRQFRQVDAGALYSCGLTRDNRAFCWGSNYFAQLGDGTRTQRLTPVRVAGGLLFAQLSAGNSHTCAVTGAHQAFCWGSNRSGEVGDSSTVRTRLAPSLVAGGHLFTQVAVGTQQASGHSCGLLLGRRSERTDRRRQDLSAFRAPRRCRWAELQGRERGPGAQLWRDYDQPGLLLGVQWLGRAR
jgi:hypothetical protein